MLKLASNQFYWLFYYIFVLIKIKNMLQEQANLLTEKEKFLVNSVDSRDSILEEDSVQSEINVRYHEYILSGASNEEAAELSFMDNVDAYEVEYSEEEKEAYCKHIIIRNAFAALGPCYEFDTDN